MLKLKPNTKVTKKKENWQNKKKPGSSCEMFYRVYLIVWFNTSSYFTKLTWHRRRCQSGTSL